MKPYRSLAVLTLLISIYFAVAPEFRASISMLPNGPPPVADPYALIEIGQTPGFYAHGSDRVGIAPNQVAFIEVYLGMNGSECTVNIEALDGGSVDTTTAYTNFDGVLDFNFQAGPNPGASQVSLHIGNSEPMGLQFWVLDTSDPTNNPPIINP
jgi:hypothetical protein